MKELDMEMDSVAMSSSHVKEYSIGGMDIRKEFSRIVQITMGGWTVKLGQMVMSNGRIHAEVGIRGIVVDLIEPNGMMGSQVINVWWEGQRFSSWMKFKDLDFITRFSTP